MHFKTTLISCALCWGWGQNAPSPFNIVWLSGAQPVFFALLTPVHPDETGQPWQGFSGRGGACQCLSLPLPTDLYLRLRMCYPAASVLAEKPTYTRKKNKTIVHTHKQASEQQITNRYSAYPEACLLSAPLSPEQTHSLACTQQAKRSV